MKKSFLILLILAWTSTNILSQPESLEDPEPYFMAVIVSDIDSSSQWYTRYLGFEVLNRVVNEERSYKIVNLKHDKALIELIELDSAVHPADILPKESSNARISGFFKFGFSISDFDEWIQFLTGAGVEFHGRVVRDDLLDKRMVIIRDPDGNRIQLFEK